MKALLTSFIFSLIYISSIAQCNQFYTLDEGDEWEITSYNNKDKVEGRHVTKVSTLDKKSNGWDAVMQVKMYDNKGKLILEQLDVALSCNSGIIEIDMERLIPQESMAAFKSLDVKMETENLELPNDLEVGMSLNDGGLKMTTNLPIKMETKITNRKVVAKETVTTPAGTFDCYKITYDMTMKMMGERVFKNAEWVAKDKGVIKTESYNEKGKLMSYTLLTNRK